MALASFQTTICWTLLVMMVFVIGSEAANHGIIHQITGTNPNTIVVTSTTNPPSSLTSNEYYRMILASTGITDMASTSKISKENNDKEEEDDILEHLFGFYNENSSHQCSTWEKLCCLGYCGSKGISPNHHHHYHLDNKHSKPLWWLILQWMKMMVFKMMRDYHAKPLVLVLAPFGMGLLAGYWIGQQRQQQQQQQPSQTSQHQRNPTTSGPPADKEDGLDVTNSYLMPIWIIQRITVTVIRGFSMIHVQTMSAAGHIWRLFVFIWRKKPRRTIRPTTTLGISDGCHPTTRVNNRPEDSNNDLDLKQREDDVRTHLQSNNGMVSESGITKLHVPRHVAVIMDGNRRYGTSHYGSANRGHWEGSSKLVEFAKWCLAEHIQVLTVFAFSSENWNRDPAEVASLMQIFAKYCDELRQEAIQKDIKILVLSTDQERVRKK
jgi:hypothetical protein